MVGLAVLGILVLLGIFVATKSFKVVGQAEVMVIERLGRFHRLARSGFNILIPFIELPRTIVGEMELDATLGSRDVINRRMREVIEEASIGWGVDVTRVELQSIEPPRDIQQSMELQMRAERERRAAVTNAEAGKRAAILEAEGVRESQVRRAEGERDAAVLRAKGLAEARLAMAEAEAEAIHKIGSALPEGQAAMYLLGMKYLEALPTLAQGKNSTIFLPAEAAGVMGAIGGLRELVNKTAPQDSESMLTSPRPPKTQG